MGQPRTLLKYGARKVVPMMGQWWTKHVAWRFLPTPATPKAARMPTHTKAAPTVDGGCVRCFRPREDNLFKLCARCRTMARKRYHQRKADRAKTAPAP